jgi:iron(III) transport system ATP-binding protein
LSNVDAKVRERLRVELVTMQHQLHFAGAYVTHDQVEALQLADRLAVMEGGQIQQIATPLEVYRGPATQYVAQFIGQTNELHGSVSNAEAGRTVVATDVGEIVVDRGGFAPGTRVCLIVRPEDVRFAAAPSGANSWPGSVETAMFSGAYVQCGIRVGGEVLKSWALTAEQVTEGATGWVTVAPDAIYLFEER